MEDRRGLLPFPGLGQLAGPAQALGDLSFGSTVQAAAPAAGGARALCVASDVLRTVKRMFRG